MLRNIYETKTEELIEDPISELPESKSSSNDDLFEMNTEFVEADQKNYPGEYLLTERARAPFEVYICDGKLYDAMGEPFLDENCIFVLSEDNVLYACPIDEVWKHSFFLAGGPVKAAGFIRTDAEGYIEVISNESGHYTPSTDKMLPALKFFYEQLPDLVDRPVIYEKHDEAPYPTRKIKLIELSDMIRHLENTQNGDESYEDDFIFDVIKLPNSTESTQATTTATVGNDNIIDVEDTLAKISLFSPRHIIKSASYDGPKTKTYDSDDGYDDKSPISIFSPKISEDGSPDCKNKNIDNDDGYDKDALDIQPSLPQVTSIFRSGSRYGAKSRAPKQNPITKSVSLDLANSRENSSPDSLAESFIELKLFSFKQPGQIR